MSLMPVAEALRKLLHSAAGEPPRPCESVELCSALGRVLADPVIASADVPPWDNSAMDGYALHTDDLRRGIDSGLPISQRITAGMAPQPLEPGTCARIFTGAPIPAGADCVEMQENVREEDGAARFSNALRPGQNIRPRGQDLGAGNTVLEAGHVLRPQDLGVIASVGMARVKVCRPLRVAVLSTGNELVEPDQPLGPGQIYNSNRFTIRAALQRLGQEVIDGGILPDDPELTRARLRDLTREADVIITSGGVSVGEADYLGQVLRDEGQVDLWKLAIKPGKPFTLGQFDDTPILGLPGNPAASLVTFVLLVKPYLQARLGVKRTEPLAFPLAAGFRWDRAGTRDEYARARIEGGQLQLCGNQSSGVLSSASHADGLVLIRAGSVFEQGAMLDFFPFEGLFD